MPYKSDAQRKAIWAKRNREKDRVYSQYHKKTNMTLSELKEWSKTECSKKASLSREPINRNIRLLSTPKSQWKVREVEGAKKTIRFITRHEGQPRGKPRGKNCPSGRVIALKNWANDPDKK